MTRHLGWLAIGGLGIGIACLSLAFALGGRHHGLIAALAGGTCDARADSAMVERRFAWTGGDAVHIAVPATVRYRGGSGSEVVVRAPAPVIDHLSVHGGTVALDCHPIARSPDIEITLPGQVFRRIELSGSVRLVMENVDQADLAVHVAGSGGVTVAGRVELLTLNVAGSGHARLGDLALKRLTVKVSGSGNVEAAPTDAADINIAGSGDVRLLVRPKSLQSRVAGSGRISQPPPDSAERK